MWSAKHALKSVSSGAAVLTIISAKRGKPVVATVDLGAPDAYLVDPGSKWQSRWLLANTTVLRLPPGEKFYEESQVPRGSVPNEFSLFAQTVKRRRAQAAVSPSNP